MGGRKAPVGKMGKPTSKRGVGIPGPLSAHCRTDDEGNAKLQEILAHVGSQMGYFRQEKKQQHSQLVSPFSQLFGAQKVCNGNANKVLVTITVLGSAGPLRVILASNASANEVKQQALELYSKEGRRPALGLIGSHFELRYLQEPSQVLDPNVRIGDLIFRQFLLCHNKNISTASSEGVGKKKVQSLDVEGGNSWWISILASMTSRLFMQTVGKTEHLHA